MFAISKIHTPLFSVPNWPAFFQEEELPIDSLQLFRPLDRVALPETKFRVSQKIDENIWEVQSLEFPETVYTDRRFLEVVPEKHPERKQTLPSEEKILSSLRSQLGSTYIWGGNAHKGVPEMFDLYPPSKKLSEKARKRWFFCGVDCSGLLYEACNGCVPRNTSELLHFGKRIPLKNRSILEMKNLFKPLDLLVWKGHVILILDDQLTIESRAERGEVYTTPIVERLQKLLEEKKVGDETIPHDLYHEYFFLQRWR